MMLINVGREYCLCGNVGFPFVNLTYEAAIALISKDNLKTQLLLWKYGLSEASRAITTIDPF
jgi:hypothetical protein